MLSANVQLKSTKLTLTYKNTMPQSISTLLFFQWCEKKLFSVA